MHAKYICYEWNVFGIEVQPLHSQNVKLIFTLHIEYGKVYIIPLLHKFGSSFEWNKSPYLSRLSLFKKVE